MNGTWNFARRPFQDDRPVLAVAAILVLAGAGLLVANIRLFATYRHGVSDVRADIAALEARQSRADEKARAAKTALSSYRLSSMAEESRELARIVAERRFSWTTLLSRLERTLPTDVGITRLQPTFGKDGGIVVELALVARNRDPVVPTIVALSKDPFFGGVELQTETVAEGAPAADPFQFHLSSRYTPEAPR